MPVVERTPQRLVLRSGSTILTLDKEAGRATLQRKILFWHLKPTEGSLGDIRDVTVDAAVDRASGVEICSTVLVMRTGAGWEFPCSDKQDARAQAAAILDFIGMQREPEQPLGG